MKHLRLFPNAQVRDSVLADIDYPVLHSTDGVGLVQMAYLKVGLFKMQLKNFLYKQRSHRPLYNY